MFKLYFYEIHEHLDNKIICALSFKTEYLKDEVKHESGVWQTSLKILKKTFILA